MNTKNSSVEFPNELDPQEIHSFLLKTSAVARDITLKYFRKTVDVENKEQEGFDPVTAADREAEKAIRELIAQYYPEHSIFGEEWEPKKTNSAFSWIIDPIDGTRAFISGLPVWGTLVALNFEGRPVAGLMSQPHIGEDFVGLAGASHMHTQQGNAGLQTSTTTSLANATVFTTSPRIFLNDKSLAHYNTLENTARLARYGLDCYGYAMVASGHGELVVEEGLKDVDIAAMVPIVECAGGIVTTWSGKPVTDGGQVIAAANEEIHAQALEILAPAATD